MKKLLVAILSGIMIFTLCSCSGADKSSSANSMTREEMMEKVQKGEMSKEEMMEKMQGQGVGNAQKGERPNMANGEKPNLPDGAGRPENAGKGQQGSMGGSGAKDASMIGRIKNIVGNEVTLDIMVYGEDNKLTKTESEEKVIIPVGLKIGTGDYTKLTSGTIIGIYKNSEDQISKVITIKDDN